MASWTQEKHDRLLVLVAAGLTGREIGVQLETTRSAVLGYCFRKHISLPLDDRKRAMSLPRKRRNPPAPRTSKFPASHPSRASRPFGARAFSDEQIATAIAARLAGLSRPKAARLIGAGQQILSIWEKKPELVAKGRALFDVAKADAAERAARAREIAAFEAETKRLTVERTNWPILGQMSERQRDICERRIAGETLQEIAEDHGVTRERIRQIEAVWRSRGLIVPGLRPLSEVTFAKFGPKPRAVRGRPPVYPTKRFAPVVGGAPA